MKNLLVLCTGNSCRSQLAHGYFEHFTDGRKLKVFSAGIETHGVNPFAVKVMKEDGIDISSYSSNNISEYDHINFDFVITVCDHANERCPVFPTTAKKFHKNFTDPAKATGTEDEILDQFRKVRDEIKLFCIEFIKKHLNDTYVS
jgi:arsenate reductase